MTKSLTAPLSYSSATLLSTCEQKFVYYKTGVKYDPDTQQSDSLVIGSAFHYVLEQTKHEKPQSLKPYLDHCCEVGFLNRSTGKNETLDLDDRCLVHAMVLKYLRLHARRKLEVVAVEFEIKTEHVIGYVDAIMKKADGVWYIVDLKTAAGFYESKMAALPRDPQLNLYAAHAELIANKLKLDARKFGGCLYSVTTKSKAKRRPEDNDVTYTHRLLNQYVKSYDIFIPAPVLQPAERMQDHLLAYHAAGELLNNKKRVPIKNYGQCLNWNRPCEYWSKCYGLTHSELMQNLKIEKEE